MGQEGRTGRGGGRRGGGRRGGGRRVEYTYELHCVPDNILVWTHAGPRTSRGGSIQSCQLYCPHLQASR